MPIKESIIFHKIQGKVFSNLTILKTICTPKVLNHLNTFQKTADHQLSITYNPGSKRKPDLSYGQRCRVSLLK